jgi:DNA polymerase III sliding clamp (beta) subunit (PCNA family)
MMITTQRKETLEQVKRIYKVVPRNSPLPALSGIHVSADKNTGLHFTATNLETTARATIRADVETGGETVVNAALLAGMLTKLDGETVRMKLAENRLSVIGEKARYDVSAMPCFDFPETAIYPPENHVSVKGLKKLIESAAFAASRETPGGSAHPTSCCVKLILDENGIRAAACDGYRLIEAQGDAEAKGEQSLLVPARALETLASISSNTDVFELGVSDDGKRAVFFDGTLLFAARLIEGSFCDVDGLFSSFNSAVSATLDAGDLKNAMAGMTAIDGKRGILELAFTDGAVRLLREEDGSRAGVTIAAETPPYEKPLCYTASLLAETVKHLKGELTLDVADNGMLRILCDGVRYIQLARTVNSAEKAA